MSHKESSAQKFVNWSTTLWNEINTHPDQLDVYGRDIFEIATLIGSHGLRILANKHLHLTNTKPKRLIYSSMPQKILFKQSLHGKTWTDVGFSKNHSQWIRKPKLIEIQGCFYKIFTTAILQDFKDKSRVPPNHIKFLMRLSGLKIHNAPIIINEFRSMIQNLRYTKEQTGAEVQKTCQLIPSIVNKIDHNNLSTFLHIIQDAIIRHSVYITSRNDYIKLSKIAPKETTPLNKVPNDPFVTVQYDLSCRHVKADDLKNMALTFIYYLS